MTRIKWKFKACSQDAKQNKISYFETLIELLSKVPKYTALEKMIENITISSYIFFLTNRNLNLLKKLLLPLIWNFAY